jgi:ABC-type polysaccharide/polyol phosphate export permease
MSFLMIGLRDVAGGLAAHHVWRLLAANDISRRYKRSIIGQLWLTISMAAMILGMGLVFSTIFKIETALYMPFLAVSIIAWQLISQTVNESCTTFMENEGFIKQLPLSIFAYVMRTLVRCLMVAGHNAILIPLVFLWFDKPVTWLALLAIPGLILVFANLAWLGYVLAIISARFRDVPQIVASVVQVMFFLTPVMFKPQQLPPDHVLIVFNPGAYLLSVVRDPLIGTAPEPLTWIIVTCMAIAGWCFATVFGGRYGRRVPYWM